MAKSAELIWSNCLKIIKDIVEWQHFKTWFEPIQPVDLKENVLLIQVPSQFFYEYIEEHYVNLLAKTLKRELGKEARLEYRIMNTLTPMSKRTAEDIYLEYVNDWLTIDAMAENY